MFKPLVSILIPTYNRAHLISETLDSIMAQTYDNWECIIIDDGCTDNTKEIVEAYCEKDHRFKYHSRPAKLPKGGNAARNYGFKLSKGKYVNWFDDDDLMHEKFIEIKQNLFDENTDFVLTLGSLKTNSSFNGSISINRVKVEDLFKDFVMWKFEVFTPNVIFNKEFLLDKDLFCTSILRGQETEYFSRIFFTSGNSNYKIINAPLFYYRQHEQTKSNKSKKYNSIYKQSQVKIYIKNLKRSLSLSDKELIEHCLILVIDAFFSTVKHKDSSVSNYILKELYFISRKINKWKAIKIVVYGHLIMNIGSIKFRIKRIFKNSLKFIYS